MSADCLTHNQLKDLISELTFVRGPISAKDWILTHIHPGTKQAFGMSVLMSTWAAMTS